MADNLTPAQRSWTMSRIRSSNTKPELAIKKIVRAHGFKFKANLSSLPGKPDLVFSKQKVVVFVDGDYWHGWRFTAWKSKLTSYWKNKIESNRKRDRLNVKKLRKEGWVVIRIWEHQIRNDPKRCMEKIAFCLTRKKAISSVLKKSN